MKQLKSIIALMAITFSMNGQTIGDDLATVFKREPGGTIEKTSNGVCYIVEGSFKDIYFFDTNNICHQICVYPKTSSLRINYVNLMDEKFRKIKEGIWHFETSTGLKLKCEMADVDNVGTVFWISERK